MLLARHISAFVNRINQAESPSDLEKVLLSGAGDLNFHHLENVLITKGVRGNRVQLVGNFKKAQDCLEALIRLDSESARQSHLSRILDRNNDPKEFIRLLYLIVKNSKSYAFIFLIVEARYLEAFPKK